MLNSPYEWPALAGAVGGGDRNEITPGRSCDRTPGLFLRSERACAFDQIVVDRRFVPKIRGRRTVRRLAVRWRESAVVDFAAYVLARPGDALGSEVALKHHFQR